mgnify:CR=1 FL=1
MLLIRLFSILLFCLANTAYASGNNISQQVSIDIVDIKYIIEDQAQYDFGRIRAFDESRWQKAQSYPLNLGNLEQGAWIRFDVANVEGYTSERILEVSNPGIHKLSIYRLDENNQLQEWQLGSHLSFIERPFNYRNFAISITLLEFEKVRFYMRAESNVGVLLPISVKSEAEFWRIANNEYLTYGMYFGILMMFIAFNMGMFLVRNNYVFFLLAIDLLIFGLMYSNHLGLNFEYLWPVDPEFNYLAGLFFSYLVVLAANIFTHHFLKVEEGPVHLSFYYGFNALALVGFILLWFIPINISSYFCAVLGVGIAIYLLALAIIKWQQEAEYSFYYLASYGFAALATLVYIAHKLALLPTNMLTNYAIGYSILLQAIVLTCVLIERKKEKVKVVGFQTDGKIIPASSRDWIAQFSHEVRTPLNGVIGMADLLKETPLNPTQYNYVRILSSSSEHLNELVGDLLDYESLAAGSIELNKVDFNLITLCKECCFIFERQAQENDVELSLQFNEAMPEYFVGDPLRLKQVLMNLLSNAIKFTQGGQVVMKAEYLATNNVQISVWDNGIGMTKQQQQGIFERFRQADQAIHSVYGGSGLGLSICRQLVNLMEGRIDVQSKRNEYSLFTLTIPFITAHKTEEITQEHQRAGALESENAKKSLEFSGVSTELTVLGVDDNEINRRVLNAMLKKLGHRMVEASSGQEALDIVRSGLELDLILMDCEMPGMDGFETTSAIRKWQYGQAGKLCPIVALTAHALDEHKERCVDAGMDSHLSKPLHLGELKNIFARLEGEQNLWGSES